MRFCRFDELGAERQPEGGVKGRERLIEKKARRLAHDRLCGGDALALAARELRRQLIEKPGHVDGFGGARDTASDFRL